MLSHSVPTSDTYSDAPGSAALAAAAGRGLNGHQVHTRDSTPDSDDDDYEHNFDHSFTATPGLYDPYAVPMYTPHLSHAPLGYHGYPYEVDVKTERQMFINDVPTRRDSTISTFSTFVPPPPHAALPAYTGEDWSHAHSHHVPEDIYGDAVKHEDWSNEEGLDFNVFDFSHHTPALVQGPIDVAPIPAQHSATVPMEECDQELFEYLVSDVLRLLYPILEANQHGSVQNSIIMPALETNQAYLHSCLHAAGLHKRANSAHLDGTAILSSGEILDHAIQRHKFSCISEVVSSLNNDVQTHATLEATLGMIAMSTVVGHSAEADRPEKDIPWHSHFQAATALVSKLNLPSILEDMIHAGGQPPFNMTLTAWIDILGSTMQGKSPSFANTYRNKHLNGSTSGLAELMGCHDGVMYLLSEVACLDSLKVDRKLDDVSICSHITSLAQQLDATDPPNEVLQSPYSRTGALRPKQLSKNITAIFRKAARVYLCSMVPNYNRYDPAICNLIAQMADILQYIPSGPKGFDRSLVWPFLICGANCIPTSPLRRVLAERLELLGEDADHGSFGRMVRLLHEVWRQNDEIAISANVCEATPVTAGSPGGSVSTPIVQQVGGPVAAAPHQTSPTTTKNRNVHWRDVMQQYGWDFLLI